MNTRVLTLVGGLIGAIVASIALAWIGFTRYVLLSWLTVLAGYLVAVGLAFPIALYRAEPVDGRAVISLDPRGQSVDLRVDLVEDEELAEMELLWGELQPVDGTRIPAKLALWYNREENEAVGTWWQSLSPDQALGYIHKLDEVYTTLEREAAKATEYESTIRTKARRSAQAMQREHMRTLDDTTIPSGDQLNDYLDDDVSRTEPDDHREGETDDLVLADEETDLDGPKVVDGPEPQPEPGDADD